MEELTKTATKEIPASIENWNRRLEMHGEFLAISCVACLSLPKGVDILLLLGMLGIFVARIDADSALFPPSLRALRAKVKDGSITDQERECLALIDARFFRWNVTRRCLPIYWISLLIFLFTMTKMICRLWHLI